MISTLDPQTALVIIDMQQGILRLNPPRMSEVVENVRRLVAVFHASARPVVAIHVVPSKAPGVITRSESRGSINLAALPADFAEYLPELGVTDSDKHITKNTWSAFYNTELESHLRALGVTEIILCGVATSIGVEGTARGAAERGFNIAFAIDAMSDMVPSAHEHSINTIFPRLGERATTDELVSLLGG